MVNFMSGTSTPNASMLAISSPQYLGSTAAMPSYNLGSSAAMPSYNLSSTLNPVLANNGMNMVNGLLGNISGYSTVPMTNTFSYPAMSQFGAYMPQYQFPAMQYQMPQYYATQSQVTTPAPATSTASSGGLLSGLLGGLLGGGSNATSSNTTGSSTGTGGLLGGGLIGWGNRMQEGGTGMLGIPGLLGGMMSSVGTALGGITQGVHHLAERVIDFSGLGPIFGPLVDDPIIHPLLWDPISMITGYDVSSHPTGVANVSNPLGVNR